MKTRCHLSVWGPRKGMGMCSIGACKSRRYLNTCNRKVPPTHGKLDGYAGFTPAFSRRSWAGVLPSRVLKTTPMYSACLKPERFAISANGRLL